MVSNPVITLLQNVRALYNVRMIPYVCSLCDQVFSVSCSLLFSYNPLIHTISLFRSKRVFTGDRLTGGGGTV